MADDLGLEALHRLPTLHRIVQSGVLTDRHKFVGKESWQMRDEIRAFIVKSLLEMDLGLDIGEIEDDTVLGTEGLDLESLVMADLAIRVEDRFGVQFDNDEAEQLALMTVGEFADTVAARVGQGSAAEPSHP